MNAGFIGTGSMGAMLVRSFVGSGVLPSDQIWAFTRTQAKLDALKRAVPGLHTASPEEIAGNCQIIFLCVKPADVFGALTAFKSSLLSKQLLVTLANAVPLEAIERRVPCRVAKVIPSLTQEASAGVALVIYGSRSSPEDKSLLEGLLGQISHPVVVPEDQARIYANLTSCGPAFFAFIFRAMAEAAVRAEPRLTLEVAHRMIHETVAGTLRLLPERGMQIREIIDRVAVPGGMTATGLEVLNRHMSEIWPEVFQRIREQEEAIRKRLPM